jgi:Family of unknown function (DUF6166)
VRTYRIVRTEEGVAATVNGRPLPLRTEIVNHSPTGFEFGYGGSGPAQLAVAILADHFERNPREVAEARALTRDPDATPRELARRHHQRFKSHVVAVVPSESAEWTLSTPDVATALRTIYAAARAA